METMGYARISTEKQSINRQVNQLNDYGVDDFRPTDTALILLNDPLDYRPENGKMAEMFIQMTAMFAEVEREMTKERFGLVFKTL